MHLVGLHVQTGLEQPPTCMCIIPPSITQTGKIEVLLATAAGSIIVVDTEQAVDQV